MRSKKSSRGPPAKRRILIVNDHPLLRRGLHALIDTEPDLSVCAEATTEKAALEASTSSDPHLVIVDLSLEAGDSLKLVKQLRSDDESLPILVLTMHEAPSYAQRAFRAGASGYVNKGEISHMLLPVIRRLLAGEKLVGPKMPGRLSTI